MDSATILFFKCQRWDNTILTEKMEELFITKIKGELPHRSPQSQYDFSNYTQLRSIRCYTAQAISYPASTFKYRSPLPQEAFLCLKKDS